MERSQLLYAVTAAKYENMTRAAQELHLSQPSLSSQIINLENELGIKLFERSKRKLIPTVAGKVFVQRAEKILSSIEELKWTMDEYASLKQGTLRIGVLPTMTTLDIPHLLKEFQTLYPDVELSLLESGSTALVSSLKNREIDVAFLILKEPALQREQDHLSLVKIREGSIMLALSPKHPFSKKDIVPLNILAEEKFISSTDDYQFREILYSYFEEHKQPYRVAYKCSQVESCLRLVEENLGCYFCTKSVSDYYKHLDIVVKPITPQLHRSIYLASSLNAEYHPVVNAFLEFAKNKF